MPFPNSHGSSTFQPPPLDGSFTITQVLDYNGTHSANHTLFRYEKDGILHDISWGWALTAIHKAARLVQTKIGPSSRPVAILASLDTITYYTLIVGIMRAGYLPFPISNRNSAVAVASLLETTGSVHIFATQDPATRQLVKGARDASIDPNSIVIIESPLFEDLYTDNSTFQLLPPVTNVSQASPGIILHSSGSTAFPKPIKITMRLLMENGLAPYYGDIEFCEQIQASHGLPMFHLMGVIQISWTTFAGLTMAVFPPSQPPVLPTPDLVFDSAVSNRCTTLLCVPAFIEMWFKDTQRRKKLKTFDLVMFAGGPLESSVGDALVADGVKLAPVYGMTECGPASMVLPKTPLEGWAYWRLSGHLDATLIPYDEKEGIWHLILKQCATHHPAILNTTIDGVPALDTNDLLIRHPQNPDLLQVYGRSDDQIMHSTGEKTNPVPLEAIISRDPRISGAIMFGTGRFHVGVIIAPTPEYAFDTSNTERLVEYRNLIWPTVQEANEYAPSHSRIFKEMILVTHPAKPFEYTPKLTPRRKDVLSKYAREISIAYDAVKESSQLHLPLPSVWEISECFRFVRRTIREIMVSEVEDDEDIFQNGCDSLQATWIRNTILHALNSSGIDIRKLSHNFVYANPTIRRLGSFLNSLFSNPAVPHNATDLMKALAQKYSASFPPHIGTLNPSGEVVLITGTTGGLGCQILYGLLHSNSVSKVYAVNRTSADPIQSRQTEAFRRRALDVSILFSDKLVLLEAKLPAKNLNLDPKVYQSLSENVTCIIHNAWEVNFNLSLVSMEPLLLGTRNLIDLALASKCTTPARFVFISSISVFSNWPRDRPAPESHIVDPAVSVGNGYSESKWCAEHILHMASATTTLKPVIIRVGQLCGSHSSGTWNTTEWFPSLVASSRILKSVPDVPGVLSWLPIDYAADIIIELASSQSQYFNVVHPSPVAASKVFLLVASYLDLPLVPYSKWLASLEASHSDFISNNNPALRLLDFFQANRQNQDEVAEMFGLAAVDCRMAVENSKTLSLICNRPLSAADVDSWFAFWKTAQFL